MVWHLIECRNCDVRAYPHEQKSVKSLIVHPSSTLINLVMVFCSILVLGFPGASRVGLVCLEKRTASNTITSIAVLWSCVEAGSFGLATETFVLESDVGVVVVLLFSSF